MMAVAPSPPLELPRQVMRRALVVALGGLLLTLLLGLLQAGTDTRRELDGALALARASERLANLGTLDNAQALQALTVAAEGLRHLRLTIVDRRGSVLYRSGMESSDLGGWPDWLPRPGRALAASATTQSVSWQLARGNREVWTVHLTPLPDSEQAEALASLLDLFTLMAVCSAAMLLVMRWYLRRAFRPLTAMLAAIERLERQELAPVQQLPTMPIRELESISAALKHLAGALERAEAARRVLAHQVLSLQEDERHRLAGELHDEFGQRLTALRVDAAWLARRVPDGDPMQPVIAGMSEQIALIQQDVRQLLARLRPLGPVGAGEEAALASLARLHALLQALVDGWRALGSRSTSLELDCRHGPEGQDRPLDPVADAAWMQAVLLPRPMVLAVYRITQEALTNIARHAGARHARVRLRLLLDAARAGEAGELHWSVLDDGVGLPDASAAMQQGNGLAGMQERVWSLDGEFGVGRPDSGPGVLLRARLPFTAGSGSAEPAADATPTPTLTAPAGAGPLR